LVSLARRTPYPAARRGIDGDLPEAEAEAEAKAKALCARRPPQQRKDAEP